MSKPTHIHKSWTHVRANHGQGLEEQHIYKVGPAPAVSLKKGPKEKEWTASLLYPSGISTSSLAMTNRTLDEAKAECESTLRDMGWELDNAAA